MIVSKTLRFLATAMIGSSVVMALILILTVPPGA